MDPTFIKYCISRFPALPDGEEYKYLGYDVTVPKGEEYVVACIMENGCIAVGELLLTSTGQSNKGVGNHYFQVITVETEEEKMRKKLPKCPKGFKYEYRGTHWRAFNVRYRYISEKGNPSISVSMSVNNAMGYGGHYFEIVPDESVSKYELYELLAKTLENAIYNDSDFPYITE